MLFNRKKKASADVPPVEASSAEALLKRRHYRRVPGHKQALSVVVSRNEQVLGSGVVGDIAIGGARVVFAKGPPPPLNPGDEVFLSFDSLAHSRQIIARARFLRRILQSDGSIHHAFQFSDLDALYPQLDTFFWNFFNRRRFLRVRPALDRRLNLSLRREGLQLEVALNDLSLSGASFLLDATRTEGLLADGKYELSFPIPGSDIRFATKAERRHATARGRSVLFGLEFSEFDATRVRPELRLYVEAREAEIARWVDD